MALNHFVKCVDGPITVHRADFLKILTNAISNATNVNTHFKKRMTAYEESSFEDSNKIVMEFSDGTRAEADVLIGCDGLKSATRRCMYEFAAQNNINGATANGAEKDLLNFVEPTWTGTVIYRSLVEAKWLTDKYPEHRAAKMPVIVL